MRRLLDVTQRAAEPDRPTPTTDVDARMHDLLVRLAAQERVAEAALPGSGDFFGWPAWSMDTGLTEGQERFVEHWSPQRVLDDSRAVRQLVGALQRWRSTHDPDTDLDDALSTFATEQAR